MLAAHWGRHLLTGQLKDLGLHAQVKEVEAAAERAAAQSASIIEDAMAQAEETRRRAKQDTQSQVGIIMHSPHALSKAAWNCLCAGMDQNLLWARVAAQLWVLHKIMKEQGIKVLAWRDGAVLACKLLQQPQVFLLSLNGILWLQAMEIVGLRDRLAEAEESRGEARQKLGSAHEDIHRLEGVILRLEQDVDGARA